MHSTRKEGTDFFYTYLLRISSMQLPLPCLNVQGKNWCLLNVSVPTEFFYTLPSAARLLQCRLHFRLDSCLLPVFSRTSDVIWISWIAATSAIGVQRSSIIRVRNWARKLFSEVLLHHTDIHFRLLLSNVSPTRQDGSLLYVSVLDPPMFPR